MRKFFPTFAIVVSTLVSPPAIAEAGADLRVPPGYTVIAREALGEGLTHVTLARTGPAERVHVARLAAGSPLELRAVLSNNAIAEPGERLERTSRMCARISCLVAVNADFFAEGRPVGGVVTGDELMRSPNPRHHQFMLDANGKPSTGTFAWKATLVPTDLSRLSFDGVNEERQANQLMLYTPAFGPTTLTNGFGVEIPIEVVDSAGPIREGETTIVRFLELRENAGDSAIPANGAVISGHGRAAEALLDLWSRIVAKRANDTALLRVETTPSISESVGGTPILVRNGARWFADDGSGLYRFRHPRTMVGWNRAGDILLVTVDGRQPGISAGMTMAEAAELMIGLGATDALNLDGGGSTTFVVRGRVMNRPSDRLVRRGDTTRTVQGPVPGDAVITTFERPVSVGIAVVRPGGFFDEPLPAGALDLSAGLLSTPRGLPAPDFEAAAALPVLPGSGPAQDAAGLALGLLAVLVMLLRRLSSARRA